MKKINHLPSRIFELDGREMLFFSGTSYFGMGHQPAFRAALAEGMAQYGTVFSVSRNNNLQLDLYDQTESDWAKTTGAEAAVTVSSGMLAGQILLKTYLKNIDNQHFIVFPKTHPALWRTPPPPQYPAPQFNDFAKKTVAWLRRLQKSRHVVLLFNSVNPLFCEPHDFDWIGDLPERHRVTLVCDDSHGLGLWQSAGHCIFETLNEKIIHHDRHEVVVSTSTGKAMGISGGLILGGASVVQSVRKSGWFSGASPIPPQILYGYQATKHLFPEFLNILNRNIQILKSNFETNLLFDELPNFPVFHVNVSGLYDFLLENDIFCSHFPYPLPDSEPLTRIVLSSLHTEADILKLSTVLNLFLIKEKAI